MDYMPKEILLKNGAVCRIRRAEEADAEEIIRYMEATSGESPYMAREPEELNMTAEEEQEFLRKMADSQRELMLYAEVDGRHAGCCSFAPATRWERMRHRCMVGISVYREFWGMGVGTALMSEILAAAKAAGLEQAELDVVSSNAPAVAVYRKLGFGTVGTIPRAVKYRDGSYADLLMMTKSLID